MAVFNSKIQWNSNEFTRFGESDDRRFWDKFMHVRDTNEPYYDPLEADFRIASHYHSNVATARKNTFVNRWGAAEFRVDDKRQEHWKFSTDYLNIIQEKMLSRRGQKTLVPVYDVIAWLYRTSPFDDTENLVTVLQTFQTHFHLSDKELEVVFLTTALDGTTERAGLFFTDHTYPNELILEVTTKRQDFDLSDALISLYPSKKVKTVNLDDVLELVDKGRRQVVFQGPPATGKTHIARQIAALLMGADRANLNQADFLSTFLRERQLSHIAPEDWQDQAQRLGGAWDIVQFHPSYTYEDFVRGITPTLINGQPHFFAGNRIFGNVALLSQQVTVPVVLIVDEINRGDLSKVMGELIFALEYRNESVRTPYSANGSYLLSVGPNFYFLATMNTADRSIALIDYAIRRRFDFVELVPDPGVLVEHINNNPELTSVGTRILTLFQAVNDLFTDADYALGHAYFMGQSTEDIARRIVFQVLPLLNEYQKEGILDDSAALHLEGWTGTSGIPFTHPNPFRLAGEIKTWLNGGEQLTQQ
jgi:hypothetical protein